MSAGQTCHVSSLPDHGGEELNTVQDGDEAGTQNAELPQQSQT